MSIIIREKQLHILFSQVNDIFSQTSSEELLVNDIRDCLMGKYGGWKLKNEASWKGLTSRDLEFLPEGKKYTSDLERIGNFENLLEDVFRCEMRSARHGSGIKYLVKKPGTRPVKKYGREFNFMDKVEVQS